VGNITTLDQLKASADWLHWHADIGFKAAAVIRVELARISAPERQSSCGKIVRLMPRASGAEQKASDVHSIRRVLVRERSDGSTMPPTG
jgi:hypothetical protein